ncbi:MAG: PEP-CTERM sorting domain-containing protein [Terriglobales bacterium]
MARKLLLLLFVLLGITAVASATKVSVGDPGCNPNDQIIHDGDKIFFHVVDGGGTFGFCNETSSDWHTLLVGIATTIPIEDITCNVANNVFLPCKLYTTDEPNVVYAWFQTCDNINVPCDGTHPGIVIDDQLILDLNCKDENCKPPFDWPNDTHGQSFYNIPTDGQGNPLYFPPVPEPATLTLVGVGIAAGFFRRRWRS